MTKENDVNFRNLVFEINDGIYICDLDGKFIYANYALACIFGYKRPADIIGKNIKEFLPPESREEIMSQFLKSKSGEINSVLITTEIIRKSDATTYIEINPAPLIKDGKLAGNQGVVHNITERKMEEDEKTKFLSTHDSLTGLYNRIFFEAEMNRLERGRQFPISIVVVNVGNLRNVEDQENNEFEDKLFKQVAQAMFNSFRGDDIVARIGMRDFAALLPNVDENTINRATERIRKNLPKNNNNESESALEFFIGTSTSEKGGSLNSALKRAESIAYLAKKKHEIV